MIFIVTKNPDTYNNPTILGLLQKLIEKNIKVTVISPYNYFKNPFPEVEHVNIQSFNLRTASISILKEIIKCFLHYLILIKLIFKHKPKLILGIDPYGLVFGRKIQQIATIIIGNKIKLDYLSFEIFFKDEGANKEKEIKACKHISSIVIQDGERDKLLRTENQIADNIPSFYIPVAPLLNQDILQKFSIKKPTFRERHNIPENVKLLVSFGSFAEWCGAEWILDAIEKNVSKNCAFIIHSRYKFSEDNKIDKKLIKLSKNNNQVILSNDYINSAEEAVAFLKQFDVGFVFYITDKSIYTGKNIYHIGNASGKFSHFMAAGIPVITNALPTYKNLNVKYNFGFIVENQNELSHLINQPQDYSGKNENCKKLFEDVLNPNTSLEYYTNLIATVCNE